ncbi:hypothetical protein BN3590_04441 [Clostridium sp. C105KSO15]|nr:hypothetical protein BN3590_04441 [Clostridium sp. C105KSO15]
MRIQGIEALNYNNLLNYVKLLAPLMVSKQKN